MMGMADTRRASGSRLLFLTVELWVQSIIIIIIKEAENQGKGEYKDKVLIIRKKKDF